MPSIQRNRLAKTFVFQVWAKSQLEKYFSGKIPWLKVNHGTTLTKNFYSVFTTNLGQWYTYINTINLKSCRWQLKIKPSKINLTKGNLITIVAKSQCNKTTLVFLFRILKILIHHEAFYAPSIVFTILFSSVASK